MVSGRNGRVPEDKDKSLHDLLVKSLVELREDGKNRQGEQSDRWINKSINELMK